MENFSSRPLIISVSLLVLLLFTLTCRSLQTSQNHLFPIYDEVTYLDLARRTHLIGPVTSMKNYATGQELEDKRNPLYVLILSTFMEHTPVDFTRAKLFTLVQCGILIVVLFIFCFFQWGWAVALASAALVALSPVTSELSQTVFADILFGLLYFSTIMLLIREKDSVRLWAWIGFLAGLTYLAKGNGHFLLVSLIVVGLHKYGVAFSKKPFWMVAALTYVAAAWFLLLRNLRVWGTPFHSVGDKVFWIDNWDQYFAVISRPIWNELGLVYYWQHHSIVEMWTRLIQGFSNTLLMLMMCLSVGPEKKEIAFLTGSIFLGLAVFGLWHRWTLGKRREVLGVSSTAALLLLAFSWLAVGTNTNYRYMFPIALTLVPFSVMGLFHLLKNTGKKNTAEGFLMPTFWVAATISVVMTVSSWKGLTQNPLKLWAMPPFWVETSTWMKNHMPQDLFLIDNWSMFSQWDCCLDNREAYPFKLSEGALKEYAELKNIQFAFVDQLQIGSDLNSEKMGLETSTALPHF